METKCRVCGGEVARMFDVPEMRYGTGETFAYAQCAGCEGLQIVTIPADLGRYYPASYHALARPEPVGLRRAVRRWRDAYAVWDRGVIGWLLYARWPEPAIRALAGLELSRARRVLDVGCGPGILARRLLDLGFENVMGIDPYADAPDVVRGDITAVDGVWDVIMFHHALEHVPDPLASLSAAMERLAPDGAILVRMPVVPCAVWDRYGVAWVQLDAPRHLHVLSLRGLETLAGRVGLVVNAVKYDSTAFQFWGSEQVRMGIPLESARSYAVDPAQSVFRPAQVRAWARESRRLNVVGRGDQVMVVLRRG
ncbi:MAG: class I SAM-dependent methyltransferase [Chloroflexi bacterium]|nr:class I SAM-dependent methyltransferase [Chloroflexota bacterium]